MDIDFNNVQDQNLVDDSIVNDINNDADNASVGSVVHPGDTAAPAGPPPPPAPAAPSVPQPGETTEAEPEAEAHVPTAQEILGDAINEPSDPVPSLQPNDQPQEEPAQQPADPPVSDDDIPEPEIATNEEAKNEETEEEHYIAPPEDQQPAEDTPSEEAVADDVAAADAEDAPVVDEAAEEPGFEAPVLGEGSGDDEELIGVKQEALEELSPLVDHLDLPPEQKFDTYMEILRASDDKTLVKPALEVAKQIEDEEKRAQALLDVVNEVNYLTQDPEQDAAA